MSWVVGQSNRCDNREISMRSSILAQGEKQLRGRGGNCRPRGIFFGYGVRGGSAGQGTATPQDCAGQETAAT